VRELSPPAQPVPEKVVEVPVERIVEKVVEVFVDRIVEKVITVEVEKPVPLPTSLNCTPTSNRVRGSTALEPESIIKLLTFPPLLSPSFFSCLLNFELFPPSFVLGLQLGSFRSKHVYSAADPAFLPVFSSSHSQLPSALILPPSVFPTRRLLWRR